MSAFDPFTDAERREKSNRLKRIAVESQQQDESRIQGWLDLARKLFDKDDDPDPQPAERDDFPVLAVVGGALALMSRSAPKGADFRCSIRIKYSFSPD